MKKVGKSRRVRREPDERPHGSELLAHLCEVMDLFPVVSDAAAGELAGRTLAARLRREAVEKKVLLGIGRRTGEDHLMKGTGMPEEYFDVVNQEDAVVGRATRREVHARGLLHRAVHVLVFSRAGELFLQKRSQSKDTAPGAWDSSTSGHVDAGEDYDACAVRELGEEIGLAVARAPARALRLRACEETGNEFVWVYRLEDEGPFTLHPEEIERGAWYRPAEIARQLRENPAAFASSFRLIWRELAARGDVPR